MQMSVDAVFNASEEIAAAGEYPGVRLFTVQLNASATPLQDFVEVEQPWSVASPAAVSNGNWTYFSAACWFFGRDVYAALGGRVPIGLVDSDWGGTPIELWSSPDALRACGVTPTPELSTLWNSMIHPLLNTTIRGVVWYQGESNVYEYWNYSCQFQALVRDWRLKWSAAEGATDAAFPFGFVQLAGWCNGSGANCDQANWTDAATAVAWTRWAQTAQLGYAPSPRLPNTFMAVSIDLADPASPFFDIHPRNKQAVGARLSLGALALVYGQPLEYRGPEPRSVQFHRGTNGSTSVRLEYAHADGGLVWLPAPAVVGFELEVAQAWYPAQIVQVQGTSVTLQAKLPDTAAPTALRYLWRSNPCITPLANGTIVAAPCPLYNQNGLPAAPWLLPIQSC
jgi:sialate O-acetylesterase